MSSLQPARMTHALGQVLWVLAQSPTYQKMPLADVVAFVMPAVRRGQCYLFFRDADDAPPLPAACVLWAVVSPETASRLERAPYSLAPDEWHSEGGDLWVVDVIAPFGGQDQVLAKIPTNVFRGKPYKIAAHVAAAAGANTGVSQGGMPAASMRSDLN